MENLMLIFIGIGGFALLATIGELLAKYYEWEQDNMLKNKKQEPLVSLADLVSMGVSVTVCKPGKAGGLRKRVMRVKGSNGYVVGGDRPGSLKAAGGIVQEKRPYQDAR